MDIAHAADLEIPADPVAAGAHRYFRRTARGAGNAAARIRAYAERQKLESWRFTEADGTVLGQQVTPLDRVGLYVPGGKAAYPSSVLMNAIPAKVAGVPEIIMVTPTCRAAC
jgi:histidinol dehydrogenase